jgi:hypothetical protein
MMPITASSGSLLKVRAAKIEALTKQRTRPAARTSGASAVHGDNRLN